MKHQALLTAVYGVTPTEVALIEGAGTINRVYRIEAGNDVFALKEYSGAPMTEERLLHIAEAQEALRAAGLPVPRNFPAMDVRPFSFWHGRFFVLSEFVAGRTYPSGAMPESVAFSMGATHAHLLRVLAGIPGAEHQPLAEPAWIEGRLRHLLAIGNQRRSSSPQDEAACLQLEQKLRMLAAWSGPAPPTEAQWTHGDYTWRNLLFDADGRVAAILDFDNLRAADPGRDVMRCFTVSFPYGSTAALSYFEGYVSISRTPAEEARRYVHLYRYISTFATWPIDTRYLDPERYDARWDEFLQPRSQAWENGWDRLADKLADLAVRAAAC